jgi:hypothetical protein
VYELKRPFHLRIPVVVLAVFATVALAALMVNWGTEDAGEDEAALQGDSDVEIQPQVADVADATRDSCPAPGTEVDPAAASAVSAFMATASGAATADSVEIRVSPEVAEQLSPEGGGAPVDRMTRIAGWALNGQQVTSCVYSYWWDGAKQQKSLDLVLVDPVSGSNGSESGEGLYTVTGWWRGEQEALGVTTIATLHFLEGGSTCGEPDQISSLGVEVSSPDEELTATLEELVSGPATRTIGGQSMVPPDVQVLSVDVDQDAATVSVTGSDTEMLRCEGRAGFDQIESTVESYLRSALRAAPSTTSGTPSTTSGTGSTTSGTGSTTSGTASTTSVEPEDVKVEVNVLVDGQESTTLRR